jgi:hypothetical protein
VLGVLAVAFWWDAYLSGAVLAGLSFGVTGKVGFAQDATTDEFIVGFFGLATQPALVAILARYSGRWADCLMAFLLGAAVAVAAVAWAVRPRRQAQSPQ